MAISTPAPTEIKTVALTIDGQDVTVPEGTTIWQAAKDVGIEIPVLCHDERYDPVGVCRLCVVAVLTSIPSSHGRTHDAAYTRAPTSTTHSRHTPTGS